MNNLKRRIHTLFFVLFLALIAGCGNESSGLPSQVGESVGQLTIVPENPSVAVGETLQLELKQGGTSIDPSEVSWFSSDTSVVLVDKNGVMKGIKEGNAEVTAVYQGQETTVTVTIMPPKATGLQVLPQVTSVAGGVVVNFIAQGLYSDGSNSDETQNASWASSSPSVATVNLGEVTTDSAGNTTISAEWNGFSASADLTVTDATFSSLNIDPSSLILANGTSGKLTATAIFSDGSSVDVSNQTTWSSDDAGVASVDDSGLVTATGVGNATITGDYDGNTQTATVNVTSATLSTISVSPATASVANGLTRQFTATANFSDGTSQNVTSGVTWSSSNTGTATIDTLGLASAQNTGTTVITADYQSQTSTANLTVTDATVLSLTIEPDSITVEKGGKANITVMANFSDGTSENVTSVATVTTDNAAIASINADNTIQAIGVGSANVTAAFNSAQSPPISVTVTNATVSSITITPDPLSLAKGTSQQLTATAEFSDGTSRDITDDVAWSTENSNLVSVSSSGLVRAIDVTAGTIITADSGDVDATLNVVVTNATVSSIAVMPNPVTIAKGDSEQLTVTATLSDASTQDVTNQSSWSSSDQNIARVDSAGVVEAVGEGSATLAATYADPLSTTQVTSPNVDVTVTAARVDRLRLRAVDNSLNILGLIRLTLTQGDELFRIRATAYYSDGTEEVLNANEVTYSSSNNALVDIDANVISLANADVIGSASITGEYQSLMSENRIDADCLTKVSILGLIGLGLACDIDDTQPNPNYVAP